MIIIKVCIIFFAQNCKLTLRFSFGFVLIKNFFAGFIITINTIYHRTIKFCKNVLSVSVIVTSYTHMI